jgi:hypothetical protein
MGPGSRTMNKQLFAVPFWTTLIALGGTPAFAGERILSDTNTGLAVNAYGGAANGTYLRLVNNCSASNTDCTWHWVNGMIVSDTNPSLAVLAVNVYGAAPGIYLRLVNNCSVSNPDCTWHYNKGMIVSDTNPRLAANAYYGATNGTFLRLVDNCSASNTDCTWSWGVLTK